MKITLTTLALKFDDGGNKTHFALDSYIRINASLGGTDFIKAFEADYAGNGIIKTVIVENEVFYAENISELQRTIEKIKSTRGDINETLLDY